MKTTTNAEPDRRGRPWQKWVADLCTVARGPLALAVVWIGFARGKDGIQLTFILLLVAATLDTLDGSFARLSPYPCQTWIGSHDLTFDIGFSMALLCYLSVAGYLSPCLAALHAGIWLWLFATQTALLNVLAVLFQAPIYAGVVLAAGLHHTNLLLWLAIWGSLMLAFAGKRFFHVRLPAFFEGFSKTILNGRAWFGHRFHDHKRVRE